MSHTTSSRPKRLLGAFLAAAVAFTGALFAPTQANAAEAGTVSSATLEWGVKDSFRRYVTSPIAHGAINTIAPATATTGGFSWTGGTGTGHTDASNANVQFSGGVHFTGHSMQNSQGQTVNALDMQLTNPRVELTSPTTGKLYVDINTRKFAGLTQVSEEFITKQNVHFAELTLPAPAITGSTTISYDSAQVVLTDAGAEGFGGFYQAGTTLEGVFKLTLPVTVKAPAVATALTLETDTQQVPDPNGSFKLTACIEPAHVGGEVVFKVNGQVVDTRHVDRCAYYTYTPGAAGEYTAVAEFVPADPTEALPSTSNEVKVTVAPAPTPTPVYTPELSVYKADGTTPLTPADEVRPGDTIVIKGTGFDPEGNVATRPPLAGKPAGAYVVFGDFQQTWEPSKGANADARKPAYATRWAMTDASFNSLDPALQARIAGERIVLDTDGSFTWTLEVPEADNDNASGRVGVYTYAAGGTVNADQEKFKPVNYVKPAPPAPQPADVTVSITSEAEVEVGAELAVHVDVAPADAGGTVEVYADGTLLGTAHAGANGHHHFTTSGLTVGEHSLVAKFTPADANLFNAGESAAHKVTVKEKVVTPPPVVEPKVTINGSTDSVEVKTGGEITIEAGPFAAGEEVTLVVHSDPVTVGTFAADAMGMVSAKWTVPADFELGTHKVVATGAAGKSAELAFKVAKAAGTDTGAGNGNGTGAGSGTGAGAAQQPGSSAGGGQQGVQQGGQAGTKALAQTGSADTLAYGTVAAVLLLLGAAAVGTRVARNRA